MPRNLILTTFLLTALTGQLYGQLATNRTVNARAELARKTITLGDQIYLDVNISAPPGNKVFPVDPRAIEAAEGIEIIDAKELVEMAQDPELLYEQRFLITSFDTGYVAIPGLPIFFERADGVTDTVYTNDLLLTVKGALVSAEEDILPIKPIIAEPRNWVDYWPVYAVLLAVAAFFGVREYRRRQTVEAPPPPPPPPADEQALAELDALENRNLWQRGKTKAYYSELTRILRGYLEGRFDISALEMTTRQITTELGRRDELDPAGRKELSQLLQLSDLVKFAKATPAEELHVRGIKRVREFVKETGKETPVTTAKTEEE